MKSSLARQILPRLPVLLLLLSLVASCTDSGKDTGASGAETGCLSENSPGVTLHFDSDTCTVVDYQCAASEESFSDDCGCGCRKKD